MLGGFPSQKLSLGLDPAQRGGKFCPFGTLNPGRIICPKVSRLAKLRKRDLQLSPSINLQISLRPLQVFWLHYLGGVNPVNSEINYLTTAGFLPSTLLLIDTI